MLAAEKELIGFFISGHPLVRYEWVLDKFALNKVSELSELAPGTRTPHRRHDYGDAQAVYKKRPVTHGHVQDRRLEGSFNAIIFPGPFEQYGELLAEDETVMLGGTIMDEEGGDPKFQVMEIFPLEQAASVFCNRLSIHLPEMGVNEHVMTTLKEAVTEFRGGTALNLCIEFVEGQKIFLDADHTYRVRPCAEFQHRIEQTLGEGLVYIAAKSDPP